MHASPNFFYMTLDDQVMVVDISLRESSASHPRLAKSSPSRSSILAVASHGSLTTVNVPGVHLSHPQPVPLQVIDNSTQMLNIDCRTFFLASRKSSAINVALLR